MTSTAGAVSLVYFVGKLSEAVYITTPMNSSGKPLRAKPQGSSTLMSQEGSVMTKVVPLFDSGKLMTSLKCTPRLTWTNVSLRLSNSSTFAVLTAD